MDAGLVDTVTQRSNSYRVLQPPAFVNQYAALPSLHVGWDLLMGIAVMTAATGVTLRVVGALMPLAMVAAVVLTANHYLLDVIAGAAVALTGLALAVSYERFRAHRARPSRVIELPEPRRSDDDMVGRSDDDMVGRSDDEMVGRRSAVHVVAPAPVTQPVPHPRQRVPAQSGSTDRTCVG
jgi:hypothetical protein